MEHQTHSKTEEKIEEAAEDLEVELPEGLPVAMKIIVLVILVGGLSFFAGTFGDIFSFAEVGFSLYIVRFLMGIILVATAYGIVKMHAWSIWLFSAFVIVSFYFNPLFSIFPAAILAYLIYKKNLFR